MAEDYRLLPDSRPSGSSSFTKAMTATGVLALVAALVVGIVIATQVSHIARADKTNVSWKASCNELNKPKTEPVVYPQTPATLIRNATIYVGNGVIYNGYDMLVRNGKIEAIGMNLPSTGITTYDAFGTWITAGLIDLHSHAGVYSFPLDAKATQDGNEMTNPNFPAVRAIDAFDPEDPAIAFIRASGVTASQILPGSGNVMGGQAAAVKYQGKTIEEMRIRNAPIALKFACGENPKNTYGSRGQTPSSRMGIGYEMRKAFTEALNVWNQQQDYCANPSHTRIPHNLEASNLVALLRHQAVLNIHCYKVVDFEMAMRVAAEFNVTIAAFHHAIEAYRIPQVLAQKKIAVALFSDIRGYKFEAYKDSVWGPRLLDQSGVKVVFKTDHPVIYGWELLFQAQKSAHWGLRTDAALQAVTSAPAEVMKLNHRIGSLIPGYDADFVIWDRHPLRLGAKALKVFIEGKIVHELPTFFVRQDKQTWTSPYQSWKMTTNPSGLCGSAAMAGDILSSYRIINANIWTGVSPVVTNGVLVVRNGLVSCVGTAAECPDPEGLPVLDMKGGNVIPGMINAGMPLGLVEVEQESTWSDGSVTGGFETSTIGGVRLQTTHTRDAWADGILTSVARPSSSKMFMGSSSAFFMGPSINFLTDANGGSYVVADYTSADIQLGNNAKGDIRSVSDQIATLRTSLKNPTGRWAEALAGNSTIMIWANSADIILATLHAFEEARVDKQLVKIVFGGAAEAHLVVSKLKEWRAGVILRRCGQDSYETRRCDYDTAIKTLVDNGIVVGLAQTIDGDLSKIRGLRWTAGLVEDLGISKQDALAMVTSNLASLYQLPAGVGSIVPGTAANWVAFNGDPLDTTSIIEALGVKEHFICRPEQA